MRTTIASQLTLWLALLAGSAQASDLLISEYIEGSSNNKALEIYNGTGNLMDLGEYALQVYFNGSSSVGANIALSGTLPDGEVFVLAHSSADAAILVEADQLYGGGLFNGDDAVALTRMGEFVDVIGQIGVDPGSQWGDSTTGTANQTLRRNAEVLDGRVDGSQPFDPSIEWTSFAQDSFDGLGQHNGNGNGGGDVVLGQCGEPATLISAVQGTGAASPLAGERHEIEAIVVADFQDGSLRGFYLQEEDGGQDGLDTSSEGLFVYDNGFGVDVNVGDLVRVGGVVTEYYDFTELTQVDGVRLCGSGLSVTAAEVSLPFASADYLERYEGMLVQFAQTLSVTDNYSLGRYGELVLSSGGRLYIPTHTSVPGAAAAAQQAANDLNRIVLDDASSVQNPEPIVYPAPQLSADNSLRSGDTVTGLRGVMAYGFGAYRIQPTQTPVFVAENARPAAPALPGSGSLRVASFNVLNYFNGNGQGGGFPTSRGADSAIEFERQRNKIIAAIAGLNADIVGLMEIENDGYGTESAIQDLVNGLNAAAGAQVYAFVDPQLAQLGGDEIAVGIIYRSDKVQPLGAAATLASFPFDYYNRQPLAQAFTELASGESLTLVINHFKSKGSCPNDGSLNGDQGDGQGCWNLIRTQAADALAQWLQTDPTGTGVERVLILGDLNSYAKENPISALQDAGYSNLLAAFQGSDAYSYVFQGQSGYLDHALANAALAPLVTGASEWHINADEPPVLDYNTEYKSSAQQEQLYAANAYRASDHDPLLVELDLTAGNQIPQANFAVAKQGKRAHFSDLSSDSDGSIQSWHWDFGDGNTSSEQNPKHRYHKSGTYTVTLQVQDDRGAPASTQQQLQMDGDAALQARFAVRSFLNWVWVIDRSRHRGEGNLSYQWDFGDGTQAQGKRVWHRYGRKGSYEITLTISDGEGIEDSASRRVAIGWAW